MSTLIPETKLNSLNYHSWKTHISFIFCCRQMLDIYTDPFVEPSSTTTQDEKNAWKLKNEEALGLIGISIIPDLYVLIANCTKAHDAWSILKTKYDSADESRKIQLQDQLEDLRYSDFKTMDEFLLKFDAIKSHLISLGVTLADIRLIHIILKKCLPRQFQQFITNVHAQLAIPTLSTQLTYVIFQNLLRQEEAKLIQFGTLKSTEHAFMSRNSNSNNFRSNNNNHHNNNKHYNNNSHNYNNKSNIKHNNNNNNHNNHHNNNHNNNNQRNHSNSKPHCSYCGKDGHVVNNCFKKQNDKKPMNNSNHNKKSNKKIGNSTSSNSRHAFTCSYNVCRPLE